MAHQKKAKSLRNKTQALFHFPAESRLLKKFFSSLKFLLTEAVDLRNFSSCEMHLGH